MNSKILLSNKPIHLKQPITGIVHGNCQSHHMVCVDYVYICLQEAGIKDRVGVGDSKNDVDWNKQGSDYRFSLMNQLIWELRFFFLSERLVH